MQNPYTDIKDIFIDDCDTNDYVNLDKSVVAYKKIASVLDKPLKIILFFGKPGSGKTFLLNKIKTDLSGKKEILFLPQPFFVEADFTAAICDFLKIEKLKNIDELLVFCKTNVKIDSKTATPKRQIILMLDESQLYPQDLIEKIRLMADMRFFKILFTVHKTEKEDVMAKDYFKTRIWESVELEPCTLEETNMYIEKRLALHDKKVYFSNFTQKHIKNLWAYSKGNLRTLNKLLYKTFELLEFYEENKPSIATSRKNISKVIDMAAIDAGILDA